MLMLIVLVNNLGKEKNFHKKTKIITFYYRKVAFSSTFSKINTLSLKFKFMSN